MGCVYWNTMSQQKQARQQAGTVEESEALRIPEDKAEQLVDALNTDLASTYVLYHQVKKHHWTVEGAEFRDIHLFLGEVTDDLEESADMLAERAQAIGGVPLSGGSTYEQRAPVTPEGEDVFAIRTGLQNDMEMFADLIQAVREHIQLARNLGDYNTEEILKGILEGLEDHAHHIEHYLEDDTLVGEEFLN
ncbi:MAG: DNA-binding ferritin-like protein, oxidative damage protectant [uncultured archaeon A07HR60]|nr:MAG: DNA-binding ferritin-like protein, oxidative damage protectant [uncultured archaeon A07HR60]